MDLISIYGMGYIGLPTAAVVSNCGFKVVGIDVNSNIIETINNGCIHIEEPLLEEGGSFPGPEDHCAPSP